MSRRLQLVFGAPRNPEERRCFFSLKDIGSTALAGYSGMKNKHLAANAPSCGAHTFAKTQWRAAIGRHDTKSYCMIQCISVYC